LEIIQIGRNSFFSNTIRGIEFSIVWESMFDINCSPFSTAVSKAIRLGDLSELSHSFFESKKLGFNTYRDYSSENHSQADVFFIGGLKISIPLKQIPEASEVVANRNTSKYEISVQVSPYNLKDSFDLFPEYFQDILGINELKGIIITLRPTVKVICNNQDIIAVIYKSIKLQQSPNHRNRFAFGEIDFEIIHQKESFQLQIDSSVHDLNISNLLDLFRELFELGILEKETFSYWSSSVGGEQ